MVNTYLAARDDVVKLEIDGHTFVDDEDRINELRATETSIIESQGSVYVCFPSFHNLVPWCWLCVRQPRLLCEARVHSPPFMHTCTHTHTHTHTHTQTP